MENNSNIKISLPNWQDYDYLYLKNNVLMCDGEYPYILNEFEVRNKNWKINNNK